MKKHSVDFQPRYPYSSGYSHSMSIPCSLKSEHNIYIPALIVHPKLQIIPFWVKHITTIGRN
jgi:hypothetical protein